MLQRLIALCALPFFAVLCTAQGLQDSSMSQQTDTFSQKQAIQIPSWIASTVQHVYGLPETEPKTRGTLSIDNAGLTFSSKASQYTVPWSSIIVLSDGSERVERWGTAGRFARMAMPDGGGQLAAGVMHHVINELTVEFRNKQGAYHGAVFVMDESDAKRVLSSYTQVVPVTEDNPRTEAGLQEFDSPTCIGSAATPSVLVAAPTWGQNDVPTAYRALIYEHIIDRMQHVGGIGYVYRMGEHIPRGVCPRYTVSISTVSFKPGNQVTRATMGPIGMFAGTTQVVFSVNVTNISGRLNVTDQIKATVRGDSESRTVTESIAKKLAKYYSSSVKHYEQNRSVGAVQRP
jgi:hypothetical protein